MKTVAKWVERFGAEGVDGLRDRSSKPHSLPSQTPPATCAAIEALRRQRRTGKQIAAEIGVSPATVSRILERWASIGSGARAGRAGPPLRARESRRADPYRHQEARHVQQHRPPHHRRRTGQSNRQPRQAGWEFVHVCIDDASRIAFSQVMKDEKKDSAVAFLKAAIAYYASLGITVERVMTDNGSCYQILCLPQGLQDASASGTSEPNPTRPRPTARPSASSRPACANGPTAAPTTPQTSAPPNCPDGSPLASASW